MTKETKNFAKALFGKYSTKHDGCIEIRIISKAAGVCKSKFFRYDEFDDSAMKEIRKLNIKNNIYFGVNPRPISKGKKQDDIKDIICLWADIDGKDFEEGKEEALIVVKEFPIEPNIIVDSGHGFHCYWIFKDPIIDISEEARIQFKQILSGIVKKLNADKRPMFLNCLLRLPGTLNIKKEEAKECKIIHFSTNKLYSLEDFTEFRDLAYKEQKPVPEFSLDFGSKELIVRDENLEVAKSDVEQLEIDTRTKNRIIKGAHLTAKSADKTRSGRDISIIWKLVYLDYNYPTIKSIFFNPLLGCSNRIREKGESVLQRDVQRALVSIKKREPDLSPEEKKILDIKKLPKTNRETKLRMITKFITENLISGEKPSGAGYRETDRMHFYYFDKKKKRLMNVEGIDFYCFIRIRYGIQKNDYGEVKDAIIAEIWENGMEIESHRFSYFDKKKFILYISDHDNGIYRLNGEKTVRVDNGTDGVFFESNSDFTPFDVDIENLEAINYFERERDKNHS